MTSSLRDASTTSPVDDDGPWAIIIVSDDPRADAMALGLLHPVPDELLRGARIRVPVAITDSVWRDCVAWTVDDNYRTGGHQDQAGRLWDVVWTTACAILSHVGHTVSEVGVHLHVVPRNRFAGRPELVTLLALCHGGDDDEPVITIMRPDERP